MKNKEKLAENLLNGKVEVYDLSNKEVKEMTEYFEKDNEAIDIELESIKEHILLMRKQLKNM